MTSDPQSQPQHDQDDDDSRRWIGRAALLLLILLGSFCCMLLTTQLTGRGVSTRPLGDVRSAFRPDYGAGEEREAEQRVAPLDPRIIEDIQEEMEATRPTRAVQVVTVVPVAEIPAPTTPAVALVTPTPTPSPTPRPTVASPTPTNTPQPQPTDTPTAQPTGTPQPSDTPTGTPIPTDTPIPTNTPFPTNTPTPTYTPTPTNTPEPTPTNTPTPPPTSTFTPTPTPTDTPTPTFTPLPPEVMSIIPNATVQGSNNLNVVITGQNFVIGLSAWLGGVGYVVRDITVTGVTDTLINGEFVPDIPVGVYALTVQNPDGQSDTLSPAFTVYSPPYPNTFPGPAFISTFGSNASPLEGDNDHVQIIFFEVPDTAPDDLYVRIFDADTGGAYDEEAIPFNTQMTYTLRGYSGAYSNPAARSESPGPAGINSGGLITQVVVGVDGTLDDAWLTLPVTRTQGELIGSARVFKLVVQGADRDAHDDDGNWYHVALSSDPGSNVTVPGTRIFAFSWCVALPAPGDEIALYPFVPFDATDLVQYNFDFDFVPPSPSASITLLTPWRSLSAGMSGEGTLLSESYSVYPGDEATVWTARYVTGNPPRNSFSLWFHDNTGTALAIFTAPTLATPPP